MYIPDDFKQEDLYKLHSLINNYNFGIIFSQTDNMPAATHLPFMLDETNGKFGTITSHMAKENPQWKSWNNKTELLVVFQGPHFYVSPAWYKNQTTVPTWNYTAVHVYGKPKIITDPEIVKQMLRELMVNHEMNIKENWDMNNTETVMEKLLNEIVAFEIPITKIEGINKFSQNKSPKDQEQIMKHACQYNPQIEKEIIKTMKSK